MKKLALVIAITAIQSCGDSKKVDVEEKTTEKKDKDLIEINGVYKRIICDSITESNIDANGKEFVKTIVACDTVIVND